MPVLEIIQPGLLTTVQDRGRRGVNFYAVPRSGEMDPNAAAIARLLLDLPPDAPLLECTSLAPTIRFHGLARIALSGADFGWTLNGNPVPLHCPIDIADGDLLQGKHAPDKLRGYLAIAGKWTGKPAWGSHSTYLAGKFGGHEGRILRKGDRLEWQYAVPPADGSVHISLHKGPEFGWLNPSAKSLLFSSAFEIGPESNRMGARLRGPQLECSHYQLPDSVPVLPGFLQLPPSQQPIVVLQDGQSTGGYPRIAYIPERELARFNQIPLGGKLRFRLCE